MESLVIFLKYTMLKIPWKYKNISFIFISIIFAIVISRIEFFHSFLLHLGGFGYIGVFIAGIFFVSTFTVATSALILLILAETLSPLEIGLIAGLGAVFIVASPLPDELGVSLMGILVFS